MMPSLSRVRSPQRPRPSRRTFPSTGGADGKLSTLREGTNGCWCMPDDPSNPKPDPMCGDAKSMDRVKGRVNRTEPPKGKVDFIYILQG